MLRRLDLTALTPALAVVLAGCCTAGRPVPYVGPPVTPAPCDRCGPAVGAPVRVAPAPVPGAVPAPPPGALVIPPAATAAPAPPPPGQVVQGSYSPPLSVAPNQPAREPTVQLATPELSAPGPAQGPEPPVATPPPAVTERRDAPPPAVTERRDAPPPPPAVTERREPAAAVPIDIPQFAMARAKVANGLQPFPDGVAWLRDHGYKTVLHVRGTGTDDAAARRQFEKYGLRYVALDADPRTLSKDAVDYFNKFVTDEANLPLFVYDKDGSLTGGLWYLHFRLVEGWSDEKARTEAARLGFRQERDDRHRTMWIAVQNLLQANGR